MFSKKMNDCDLENLVIENIVFDLQLIYFFAKGKDDIIL